MQQQQTPRVRADKLAGDGALRRAPDVVGFLARLRGGTPGGGS